MNKRVLIIGGYGNFGSHIARILSREDNMQLIIAGRDEVRARELVDQLAASNTPETAMIDINRGLKHTLSTLEPDIVIHTSGPYQGQDYTVAQACIDLGCHYIDLADAREYVADIYRLDQSAKDNGVLICSGASSVPCLTSAIVDKYINRFDRLETLDYAIATAQLTNRGLATTSAVLSYAGKPFTTLCNGKMEKVYGWLGLRGRKFWGLNYRLLGNCDIPDLEIFPRRYPSLTTIRFQAGLGLNILHLTLWMMSGLARFKLLPPLRSLAPLMLRISYLFDRLGNASSGFFMNLSGRDNHNQPKQINFELVAHQGDGLYIPSMPAILLARKLANDRIETTGAYPCVGFISLDEYLEGLSEFNISSKDDA